MYYKKVNIQKKILLLSLLIIISIMFLFYYAKPNNNEINILCLKFSINEKVCIEKSNVFYDDISKQHYFPIDKSYNGKKYSYYIKNKKNNYKYFVNDKRINKEEAYVNYDDNFIYKVVNNENIIKELNIKFTSVPIINIELEDEIGDDYKSTIFYMKDLYGSNEFNTSTKEIDIRLRGHTSRVFDKKAYRIEFKKDSNQDHLLLKDNDDWALDAMYTDTSRIRNKLSTDLWNLINQDQEDFNDLNVEYIDLYFNNEYLGLYTIKNIINRSKLGLNSISSNNSGILLKGINYIPIDWVNGDFTSINDSIYNSLELKYPSKQKVLHIYWDIILKKLSVYYKDHENIYNNIKKVYNIENFFNYVIFLEIIAGTDNVGIKNSFFSMKDINSKINLTPWDMDLSFGLCFSIEHPELLSKKCMNNSNQLIDPRTYQGDADYIKALKERYNYLRNNGINQEVVLDLIDSYVEDIYYSTLRDSERWYEYDLIKETDEIKDWVVKRFKFLDKTIGELKYD